MADVAFLGAGLIAAGMVEAALERGDSVTVWNRTESKIRPLVERGAQAAPSPRQAAEAAERVHIVMSDDAAVDAVIDAARGALSGKTLVDHTTTLPAGTKKRFETCDAAGVALLHAPVFMSPKMCAQSKGLMLCAGPQARFESVKAALERMTGEVWWVGERPDQAAAFKLFGNAMILTIVGGFADVLAMARQLDIDPVEAHSLFSKFKPGLTLEYRGANMARGNFATSFALSMARKDVGLMLDTAGDAPLAVLSALASRMDAMIESGRGDDDVAVLGAGD